MSAPKYDFRTRLKRWLVAIPLLLILYVFSIGPMYYQLYEAHNMEGNLWVAAFYRPLESVCERSDTVNEYVNSYIELWVL